MEEVKPLSGAALFLANVFISLTTFMYVLDYSIANVAIPYISGELAVSDSQGTYVITSYAVGNAVFVPLTGWLSKRFGRVKTFAVSTFLFSLFSAACGMAPNFQTIVVARFLQGAAAGPIVPLAQNFVLDVNPKKSTHKAISMWVTIVVVAPILGPLLGGWISVDYDWRWIFNINVPIGFVCAIFLWQILKSRETAAKKVPTDFLGILLLAFCVTPLQVLLDKGEQFGWFSSPWIVTFAIVSFLSFVYLVLWEYISKSPVLDLRLFKVPSFAMANLLIFISYGIYFGSMVLIPLWLQQFMGYNAIWAGAAIAPFGIFPFLLSAFVAWAMKKISKLYLMLFCFFMFALSLYITTLFTTQVSVGYIMITRVLMGFGFAFYATPLIALSTQDLTPEQIPNGTGIFQFVRGLSGGFGTSIFTTIWYRRIRVHTNHLAPFINPYRNEVTNAFTDVQHLGVDYDVAKQVIFDEVEKQASMLAFNDAFYMMTLLMIALFVIVLIMLIHSKLIKPRLSL